MFPIWFYANLREGWDHMFVKVSNIKLPPGASHEEVFCAAQQKAGLTASNVVSQKLLRRSVDARRGSVSLVFSVLLETERNVLCDGKDVLEIEKKEMEVPAPGQILLLTVPSLWDLGLAACSVR